VGVEAQPRSVRPLNAAWIGGVCAGLANQLGWPVLVLRIAFVVLAAFRLIGVVIYLILWLVMPEQREQHRAPGLESHARTGLRPRAEGTLSAVDLGVAVALSLVGIGLMWLVEAVGWGPDPRYLAPSLTASLGLGLIWVQADRVSNKQLRTGPGWRRVFAPLATHWTALLGVGAGLAALGAAVALLVAQLALSETGRLLAAVGLAAAVLVLASLPWIVRLRRAFTTARQDAMLADARADMAAHLHDSVLQTLALIQRQAADPKKVTALARRQERELRQWLYGESPASGSVVEALTEEMLDVESSHGIEVELVSVGDTELTAEAAAVVRAAREAMVNAAKHSGADRIDLYVEIDEVLISVFIRDRGVGFELEAVEEDRMGVRGSIVERVKRAGGRAIIRTAPGEGTEVRLELPR
jgi:signal transduction histidine kinase